MRRLMFGGLVAAFAGAFVFACTLDLDESLIGKAPKDGGNVVTIGDANLPDGTVITESGVPITPDGTCTKDGDCVSANGCLLGKCDLTRKACAYDICHSTACTVGVCDQAAKTCSQPQTYKEKAGELTLDQLTTGGIIAAYPWLFQMTATGVLVYDVSNPTKSKPAEVPFVGLGFVPNQFTRSGNRIWIGAPLGGSPARLPIAYIDVPADPFTGKIEAHTILANYSRPATESVGFLATENKGAVVIGPAPTYPTAALDTLLAEPATKTATPVGPKDNTVLTALSGSRFVMIGQTPLTGALTNQFGLISGVGTTNPTASDLVAVAAMPGPTGARTWGQTLDGTLLFVIGVNGPGAEPDTTVSAAVRGYILTKDGKSPIDGAAKAIEIETYNPVTAPAANADLVRAPTMVDVDTFAVPVVAGENPAATAIQLVKSDNTIIKNKRLVLPTAIGNIVGISASDGLVYVAANVPSGQKDVPATPKVFVLDPACAP
jgi:hypothetical protein